MFLQQYHKLFKTSLRPTKVILRSPGGTMKCLGQFTTLVVDGAHRLILFVLDANNIKTVVFNEFYNKPVQYIPVRIEKFRIIQTCTSTE